MHAICVLVCLPRDCKQAVREAQKSLHLQKTLLSKDVFPIHSGRSRQKFENMAVNFHKVFLSPRIIPIVGAQHLGG